jgi:methylated-DNA-protein-cysteine methyltransferase-like protein
VSSFYDRVFAATLAIPRGKVATYGQIAAIVGSPRAARMVGVALAHCNTAKTPVPWQRVVNRHGMISIENLAVPKEEQVRRLTDEQVIVTLVEGNYFVDLGRYLTDVEDLKRAVD